MKKLGKFSAVILASLCLALTLGGCAKTASQIEEESQEVIRAETLDEVREYTEKTFADTMKNTTFAAFTDYRNNNEQPVVSIPFDVNWSNRWQYFTEQHGDVKDAKVDIVERTEHGYTGRVILTGEDDELMAFTVTYDQSLKPVSAAIGDFSDDSKETFGSKMANAGGNTVTGLLVVFCILVGLSLIISSLKLVGGREVAPEKKETRSNAAPQAAAAAPAQTATDVTDDPAIAAVIAAAIAAYEDKPASGYVVRSIKRLNNNKWR